MAHQKNILRLLLDGIILVGAILVTSVVVILMGPIVENKFYPVTEDVEVVKVQSTDPNRTALSITGNKVRDCRFIEVSALSGDKTKPEKAEIFFERRTGTTRPSGVQSFGIWEFSPKGNFVKAQVVHSCHPLWETTTTFFEWTDVK